MRECGRKRSGRKADAGWDILLIADDERFEAGRRVIVDECEGVIIITARSREVAIEVLRTAAVDVVYHFQTSANKEDSELFRVHVAEHYPAIRVIDMWTLPARKNGEKMNHATPLFLKENCDCATRRELSKNAQKRDGTCRPEQHGDTCSVENSVSRSTIRDGYAA